MNTDKTKGWFQKRSFLLYLVVASVWILMVQGCATVEKGLGTRFYPPPPQSPKIQFLTRISSSKDVEVHSKFESFVVGQIERRRFGKPYGIKVYDGVIYVCDVTFGTVVVVDPARHTFDTIHDQGAGDLSRPVNMAIDEDGTKYVADIGLDQIMVYDKNNEFRKAFGNKEEFKPVDIAVSGDKLYVLDIRDHEVEILDKKTGEHLGYMGEPGSGEGQLFKPTNMTLDREGNIYVTDTLNCRVEKFNPQGSLIRSFGKCSDTIGNFVRPKGVAVDHDGYLYVVDSAFENIQIFSPEGEPALFFGGSGDAKVPGALWLPADVTITYDQRLLAYFDQFRHKDFVVKYLILVTSQFGPPYVNVYAFGEAREGTPLARGEVESGKEDQTTLESGSPPQVPEEQPQK